MLSQVEVEADKERVRQIFSLLEQHYPHARTRLEYANPFQLFVAVLLSAQTTDEQVNRITAPLFAAVPTPQKMARMKPEDLEPYLKGCGLYRNKSRYLVEASRMIVDDFGGVLPDNFTGLTSLPGIGRKSANVILNVAFGKPALAVDTHVFRWPVAWAWPRRRAPLGSKMSLRRSFLLKNGVLCITALLPTEGRLPARRRNARAVSEDYCAKGKSAAAEA